ncbi:dihydrodipicolinate synthase family protein [Rhizobiales bacterium RZME27]|uniref:Dihydrodipicolinate synthase family protein n=1 Tax=Endobacterium cereale TaxID=2663029 RepID=A0A6A8A882_9HYPH|nr:dihydrodipicolinate synthase family protein [Endobacterium cereale]MEB2847118.1 dihydrodipicolinate synthase family protein [Endobacterium cereale]MQY47465.1 dihydrodipicolinate synthase family protein [Endobacterium cereale]
MPKPLPLFTGLSAFPLTPADEAGRVDTDALQALLARIIDGKANSIGLLGSTGVYAYLTREERRRAISAAVEAVSGKLPIIAGIGAIRTDAVQALARDAAEAGADALLLAPVSYTPLTEEEAYQHYATVAATTDLPLCIYNNPSTTHFSFSEDLLARLSKIGTIKAVKMPVAKDLAFAAEITSLREKAKEDFAIGYSGDWHAGSALLAGADAWFSVVGGLLPHPAAALTKAALAGNEAETARIYAMFEPLWVLFRAHGSLRVIYAAANLLGLTKARPPRPILPLPDTLLPEIEKAIAALPER